MSSQKEKDCEAASRGQCCSRLPHYMLTPFDQDTEMNDNPDSDPFNSGSQPIRHLGPEGHFGLQP